MPPQATSIGPLRTLVLLFVCILYARALAGPGSGDQEASWDAEASACITGPPAGVQAPTAPRRPKTLLTAAGPVVDDFHWLRDDSHSDPEVLGYLTAENAYSDATLAQLQPLAAKLAAEMEGRLNKPNDPVPEDNPAFYLSLSRSSSGRFLLLSGASEVTRQVLLLDLQQHAPPSADAWLVPAPRVHGVQQQVVGHWQSWLFLLVVSPDTPNGELLVAPVEASQQHTVLLPHRREVELEDVRIYAHHLVLAERQLGHTTITVYCLPANSSAAALAACSWQVAFEEDAYSVSILDSGDWAAPLLRLSYTSFTTPHTVLDIHMFTQRRVVRSVAAVGGGFRPSDYRSYRLWASAGDGVEVPLSLVYRLDSFTRNGRNPALLMVYGAYGTKYDPEWDSRLLSLLDRGWVLGIAHVRGGGELGYAWHAAGRLEHKPNSFSDLAAAAATMIAHNLTSPGRLAVWGRSAGGLTAAGAINAEPHLFNSALLDVPFLDVVGDLVDAGLPLTVKEWDEWGHPLTNASQAAVIASYSPVHNVKTGASYPHMLVTAGLMDKRVGYWEAAKWVAQLRAAGSSSSDDDSNDQQYLGRLHGDVAGSGSSDAAAAAAAAAALDGGGVSASSSRHRRHGSHQALLLVTDMSGGHFSTGGSGSSTDDAALKYAFLIATLPSCGSAAGLTGPDVQRAAQPQQLRGMVSLVGDSGSGVKAVLSLLPVPLQRLLVGLAGLLVTAGLMSVLWQASRVWWPAGINPAVIQATLDLAASGSTPHSKHGACGGSSSCKLSSGPSKQGREVSRRTSTASTAAAAAAASPASDWHLQQRLSVSIGESTPLLLGACLSPGPASARHALSPGRLDACLRSSPAGAGLSVCGPALSQPQAPGLQLPGLPASGSSAAEQCWARYSSLPSGVCYAQQGPLLPLDLPRLEHICTSCFPACVGDKCLLSIEVTYPKGGSLLGLSPPYPLAIFSGGFTVNSAAYRSTAARLASWGYTVVRYNTRDALPDVLDDVTCVRLQRELIDWAATHPLLRRLADTRRVYAAGHSRGAKLAALTAAADPRVAALCLIDPVDVTVYAPLSDRFPSAAAALTAVAQSGRFLPVAVVGSGLAGDCAPRFNNYSAFFTAAPSAAWEVLLPAAGHFQYLDSTTALQRAVCGGGADGPDDAAVRAVSQAALVAWGEAMADLQRLLVAVSYNSAAALEVRSRFKNFG
ncbi:hypothetical protein OEZ86_008238 [Tetradesmus obliquus]|nr:hypothetical protein OEZ86_008238 [Tetradesmus obliquus]